MAAQKKLKAADLIKAAKGKGGKRHRPPKECLEELRALCEANDQLPPEDRVQAKDAMALIRSYGVQCASTPTLQGICKDFLGRTTWGMK